MVYTVEYYCYPLNVFIYLIDLYHEGRKKDANQKIQISVSVISVMYTATNFNVIRETWYGRNNDFIGLISRSLSLLFNFDTIAFNRKTYHFKYLFRWNIARFYVVKIRSTPDFSTFVHGCNKIYPRTNCLPFLYDLLTNSSNTLLIEFVWICKWNLAMCKYTFTLKCFALIDPISTLWHIACRHL